MLHALLFAATLAKAPLDSQVVLQRYVAHLLAIEAPKTMIFTYTVSQAGPQTIEQAHRVFRSGELVRDETLQVDGQGLKIKPTRITHYRNRYTVENLAPRMTQYALLFVRAVRSGNGYAYRYKAVPLGAKTPFSVSGVTIDGRTYLPSEIDFETASGTTSAQGTISFAQSGKYWVPTVVSVRAKIDGKPARERITFSAYQFPARLPKSTFRAPRPLPTPALPQF